MKKLFLIVLALVLLLVPFAFNVSAADDYVYDMSKAVGKAGFNANSPIGHWPDAGYSDDYVIAFCNYGAYASLGTIDLSKYKAVVITYGRGSSENYDDKGTSFALTSKGPIQSGQAAISDTDAGVIAKYKFVGSETGSWKGAIEETLTLNTNYNGEVFIANYLDPTFTPGFVVTGITFLAKEQAGENPPTFDLSMMPLLAMTLAGLVPLKKRKK